MDNAPSGTDRRTFLVQVSALLVRPTARLWQASEVQPQSAPGTLASVESDIPALLKKHAVPGLAIAVVENGISMRSAGFGVRNINTAAPVTGDTVFEAASLSKPPFAYLVQKLAEAGIFSLDTGIGSFFREPDFIADATVDEITPRRVLSHQTGLLNWRPPQQPQRFLFKPGAGFAYSGEAYVRLQRFVEQTLRSSLTELSRTRLFTPMRMTNSSYVWRDGYDRIAAEGHDREGRVVRTRLWGYSDKGRDANMPRIDIPLFAVPNAAASLYTSANDYGRFLEQLLAPPAADAIHVDRRTLDGMFSPAVRIDDQLSWGLGWGLARGAGGETFWHWGNNNVYQSFVVGSRERRWGTVILTNSPNGLRLCQELVTRLLGVEHPAFGWPLVRPR